MEPSTTVRVLALTQFCDVSPRLFEDLLRRFKTLDAVYAAEREDFLQIEGISVEQADQLYQAGEYLEVTLEMVKSLADRDINLLTRFDNNFSRLLFELNDPPSLLFLRGTAPDAALKSVAVVGTSTPSAEGIALTSRLVKELVAHNIQIISSLAGGVDLTTHLAARSAGGTSFAIIDCGIDHVDQVEGIPVAIDIIQSGGVLSEYAPDVPPRENQTLEVNRLIVGLAQGVVVTEVYSDSNRILDLLRTCREVGKLAFIMTDPMHGPLIDETSLNLALECGAVPIEGFDRVGDIIKSLV